MYIGLTGLMASGKSTVSSYLAQKGAYIIDADKISRLSTQKGGECYAQIIEAFGEDILLPDGEIDRKALSKLVFSNKERLEKLNSIVHPFVLNKMYELADEYKANEKDAIIVFDVPLLVETDMHKRMDEVWVVTADYEKIIERAMKRSKLTREQAEARLKNQASDKEKLAVADEVIDNSGSLETLYERLDSLFERVKSDNGRKKKKEA
ncbi:MAG: dephospho-CoA kinase [Clostridia bacterium]|nr:dephospho-CoA kinase [Clostridia bacterium]